MGLRTESSHMGRCFARVLAFRKDSRNMAEALMSGHGETKLVLESSVRHTGRKLMQLYMGGCMCMMCTCKGHWTSLTKKIYLFNNFLERSAHPAEQN